MSALNGDSVVQLADASAFKMEYGKSLIADPSMRHLKQ
jgi:hypothetical protein